MDGVWVDPYGPILILKTVVAEVDGARTIHMKKNHVYFNLLYSIFNNMKHLFYGVGDVTTSVLLAQLYL